MFEHKILLYLQLKNPSSSLLIWMRNSKQSLTTASAINPKYTPTFSAELATKLTAWEGNQESLTTPFESPGNSDITLETVLNDKVARIFWTYLLHHYGMCAISRDETGSPTLPQENKKDPLYQLFVLAGQDEYLRDRFAEALVKQDFFKRSGFCMLADHARHYLPRLFDLATNFRYVQSHLAQALVMVDGAGQTGWHLMLRKHPYRKDYVRYLFNLAKNNDELKTILIDTLAIAFAQQDDHRRTLLHILAKCAKEYLPDILALAREHAKLRTGLADALEKRDIFGVTGKTGYETLTQNAAEYLPDLLALAKNDPYLKSKLPQTSNVENRGLGHNIGKERGRLLSVAQLPLKTRTRRALQRTIASNTANYLAQDPEKKISLSVRSYSPNGV